MTTSVRLEIPSLHINITLRNCWLLSDTKRIRDFPLQKKEVTIAFAVDKIAFAFYGDVTMNTKRAPKNPDKRRVWVKAMLELKGHTYASIARELGVVRSAVRKPLDCSYPKMERIIAEKLGLMPEQIWPERYQ